VKSMQEIGCVFFLGEGNVEIAGYCLHNMKQSLTQITMLGNV
jgi:hypothetical protein